jgi:hypothetical protein
MKEASITQHKFMESFRMLEDASMHTVSPQPSKKRKTEDLISQVQISMQELKLDPNRTSKAPKVVEFAQTSKSKRDETQDHQDPPSIYQEYVECSSKY